MTHRDGYTSTTMNEAEALDRIREHLKESGWRPPPCSGFFSATSADWEDFMSKCGADETEGGREDQTYREIDLRTAADWGFRKARERFSQNAKDHTRP